LLFFKTFIPIFLKNIILQTFVFHNFASKISSSIFLFDIFFLKF
jgi:hypothetical protein